MAVPSTGPYAFERWGTGMVICLERDADLHMASTGPYENNLHLAPDRQPPHHSNFYRLDALPDAQPTVSKHRGTITIKWTYVEHDTYIYVYV